MALNAVIYRIYLQQLWNKLAENDFRYLHAFAQSPIENLYCYKLFLVLGKAPCIDEAWHSLLWVVCCIGSWHCLIIGTEVVNVSVLVMLLTRVVKWRIIIADVGDTILEIEGCTNCWKKDTVIPLFSGKYSEFSYSVLTTYIYFFF